MSVFENLLFMSVEESRAAGGLRDEPGGRHEIPGVRVFDITNLANPVQVAAVQTCRGSHTHTILKSPHDNANLYVYVNGTAGPRPASTLAGRNNNPASGENPSRWRIEVIRVPLAAPQNAAVVNEPRLFRDEQTGGSTASRTRRRRPCTRPGCRGARRRSPTPATTSPCSRRSTSQQAHVRATGS